MKANKSVGSAKPFKVRHYWMSTALKSHKKCTACGCTFHKEHRGGVTEAHFELNGHHFINEMPPCKHLDLPLSDDEKSDLEWSSQSSYSINQY